MDLKTVQTHHVPVRYLEGGSGQPLVYLHSAGGVTAEDPLLNALAETHHVYAPLLPGYGDSEECGEIRDMLDVTLHTWDVVHALGLKDPILVGHSMGGMMAAEMAAICPDAVSSACACARRRIVSAPENTRARLASNPSNAPAFARFSICILLSWRGSTRAARSARSANGRSLRAATTACIAAMPTFFTAASA